MLANYVLVDNLYHFNWPIVGGNPMLKEDEWRWQDEGRYRENGRFGRVASGVSHKCKRCNKVPTLGVGPKRDRSSQNSPIEVPILHPCPQSPELYD